MKNEIINRIKEKLELYKYTKIYACELAYTLFESDNIDGSITYSDYLAKEWIKTYFDEIREVWKELINKFGAEYMNKFNVFTNSEKFMLLIILEVSDYLLSQCKLISDNWNNTITLDKKTIEILNKQLNLLDDEGSIYK